MSRSATVLYLPLQLVFPGHCILTFASKAGAYTNRISPAYGFYIIFFNNNNASKIS